MRGSRLALNVLRRCVFSEMLEMFIVHHPLRHVSCIDQPVQRVVLAMSFRSPWSCGGPSFPGVSPHDSVELSGLCGTRITKIIQEGQCITLSTRSAALGWSRYPVCCSNQRNLEAREPLSDGWTLAFLSPSIREVGSQHLLSWSTMKARGAGEQSG